MTVMVSSGTRLLLTNNWSTEIAFVLVVIKRASATFTQLLLATRPTALAERLSSRRAADLRAGLRERSGGGGGDAAFDSDHEFADIASGGSGASSVGTGGSRRGQVERDDLLRTDPVASMRRILRRAPTMDGLGLRESRGRA